MRTSASSPSISSGHFFAHIWAGIGSAVQQTDCHPFRYKRWLFMHNGFIADLARVKRDLVLAIDESLYPEIRGQADTEILFYLALTFDLEDDPPDAVARAMGLVEEVGRRKGVKYPFQGTIATTDGERMWAFRYSSKGKSRSLFITTDAPTLRKLYPEQQILQEVSDDARLVVSEPLGDLPGVWNEAPESSYGVVGKREEHLGSFVVKPPATTTPITTGQLAGHAVSDRVECHRVALREPDPGDAPTAARPALASESEASRRDSLSSVRACGSNPTTHNSTNSTTEMKRSWPA